MVDAVAGVDVAAGCASLRAPEKLSIAAGRGAVAPDPREWQAVIHKAGPMEMNVAHSEDFARSLLCRRRTGILVRSVRSHQIWSNGQTEIEITDLKLVKCQMYERARLRSEEHTSELQSLMRISYAVFCLKKKTKK